MRRGRASEFKTNFPIKQTSLISGYTSEDGCFNRNDRFEVENKMIETSFAKGE